MFRQFIVILAISFILGCHALGVLGQAGPGIDGAYRLVSETTTLEKPKKETTYRKPPEWSGRFLFIDGYFTVSLMDNTRDRDWFSKFPEDLQGVGYDSFAGRYEIKGTTLKLDPELGLHPFYDIGRISVFQFRIEGESLILTQRLSPYVEDLRKGELVLILKRERTISSK